MCTTAKIAVAYALHIITDYPAFDGGSVSVRAENDVIRVSWATPSGFFTTITLMQCRDSVDTSDDCISHDVTDVTTLSVSRSSGTLLSLVVWQDRDDVVSYDIPRVSNYGRSTPTRGDCTDSKKRHIKKNTLNCFIYLFSVFILSLRSGGRVGLILGSVITVFAVAAIASVIMATWSLRGRRGKNQVRY